MGIFYVQHCTKEIDFDQVFRFYRKICFICENLEQLEHTKKMFLKWLTTHNFMVDYSFNLIGDLNRNEGQSLLPMA